MNPSTPRSSAYDAAAIDPQDSAAIHGLYTMSFSNRFSLSHSSRNSVSDRGPQAFGV